MSIELCKSPPVPVCSSRGLQLTFGCLVGLAAVGLAAAGTCLPHVLLAPRFASKVAGNLYHLLVLGGSPPARQKRAQLVKLCCSIERVDGLREYAKFQ